MVANTEEALPALVRREGKVRHLGKGVGDRKSRLKGKRGWGLTSADITDFEHPH